MRDALRLPESGEGEIRLTAKIEIDMGLVASLKCQGWTNEQIGKEVGASAATIKKRVTKYGIGRKEFNSHPTEESAFNLERWSKAMPW